MICANFGAFITKPTIFSQICCTMVVLFVCRYRLARVTTLVKKKQQLTGNTSSQQAVVAEDASDADADAHELEELLDWRSKKAWK